MEELKEYKPMMQLTAKTFSGLENLLAEELKYIGATEIEVINRGVKFGGDLEILYKANYLCRTAVRILQPITVFTMKDQEDLYSKVKEVNWPEIFSINQTFVVDANVFYSEITHSQYAALRVKDGIVDQFREKMGKRPWVGKEEADIHIDVHISHNVCTISLDSSGESLHKRGYRIETDKAPISEVLAAGIILLSGWKGEKDFYDPMCGSGTIPIEAAMIANNIPAGYYRKKFAFMNWSKYEASVWEKIKKEEDAKISEAEHSIFASDRSERAVGIARRNIKNAGLHKDIELSVGFFDSIVPGKPEGVLVFNPPYGMRLEERGELVDLYQGIGDTLKKNFTGFEAWIISPDVDVVKYIGLRPSARIHLFNGPIETRLIKFELYTGSKKGKYIESDKQEAWRKEREITKPAFEIREFKGGDKPYFKRRESDSNKPAFEKKKYSEGEKPSFKRSDGSVEKRNFDASEKRKPNPEKKFFTRENKDHRGERGASSKTRFKGNRNTRKD